MPSLAVSCSAHSYNQLKIRDKNRIGASAPVQSMSRMSRNNCKQFQRVPENDGGSIRHAYDIGRNYFRQFLTLQRRVWRAFLVRPGQLVSTTELLPRVFPRVRTYQAWHWNSVRRAARRFAVPVRRSSSGRGRPLLWRAKDQGDIR
jgi:hypothetical protein